MKKRNSQQELETYLCEPFILRRRHKQLLPAPPQHDEDAQCYKKLKSDSFVDQVVELTSKKLINDLMTLQTRCQQLEKDNKRLRTENNKLKQKVQDLKGQDTRCLKQKVKRTA